MKYATLLLLVSLGWAADYPLSVHITAKSHERTKSVRPVMSTSTGVITGSSVSHTTTDTVEFRLGGRVYISHCRSRCEYVPGVGQDAKARQKDQKVYVLVTDKKGKAREAELRIVGEREE